ncbi:transglutaminase domain-containing protein [Phyllobacterium salinisoli]|nr:transglutaminase domain-containing protein [Phyllobacterium salinisoli]
MDDAPLDVVRAPEKRLLTTCRDGAVLLCAMLRSSGVPARVRYGFAHLLYEPRQILHDHVVVEYWSGENWRIADSRLSQAFRHRHGLNSLDPVNISPQLFLSGGEIWKRVRNGELPARALSAMRGNDQYGLWKARNLHIYDLSSLSGVEPLLWDAWGVMLFQPQGVPPQAPEQFEFLDMMADLATVTPQDCDALAGIFNAAEDMYAPDEIVSFSPVVGKSTIRLMRAEAA